MIASLTPWMTATGVDERTNLVELAEMETVECGFLYSKTRAGESKRYPRWEFIHQSAAYLPNPCALHVCGGPALNELGLGLIDVTPFARIQINGRLRPEQVSRLCRLYPGAEIIAQYHGPESDNLLTMEEANLSILVDASGGNGILPHDWPLLDTALPVGFAGGLSPTNMFDQVLNIRKVARDGWWVDLESHLRVDEWFSLRKVQLALDRFEAAAVSGIRPPDSALGIVKEEVKP